MADPRVERLAQVLVDYCLDVKRGELMRVRGSALIEPLAREVFRLAVRKGALPYVDLAIDGLAEIVLKDAPDETLDYISPITRCAIESLQVDLAIGGGYNSYALAGVDPKRIARAQKTAGELSKRIMERSMGDNPTLRWCVALYPTHSAAQDAKMSLTDYTDFVYHAMLLDTPNPVAEWRAMSERQQTYCDYLAKTRVIKIEALDTELTLNVEGRSWINADGHFNFPDGEVFTSPVEDSASGHIRYTFPTVMQGRGAEDVRLWFENGEVVRWEAREGKELLDELFAMDDGARRLGEVAIGTNDAVPAFTRNILFDEKIGGTCHLAVGNGFPKAGGVNKSALHWDMICDLRSGGRILADGQVIHENGRWLL
jgi:aminopeptidase